MVAVNKRQQPAQAKVAHPEEWVSEGLAEKERKRNMRCERKGRLAGGASALGDN